MLNDQFQKDLLNTKLNVQEAKTKSDNELGGNLYLFIHFLCSRTQAANTMYACYTHE